jgi:hypothetical protein
MKKKIAALIAVVILIIIFGTSCSNGSNYQDELSTVKTEWEATGAFEKETICMAYDVMGSEYKDFLSNSDLFTPEKAQALIQVISKECP